MRWEPQSRPAQRLLLIGSLAGGITVVTLTIAVIVRYAPAWLADTHGLTGKDRAEEIGRVRTAILAVLAGCIASVGAVFAGLTWRLNRRGQLTDRFTRAIDQLGHHEVDVRLGGIYALEHIARESRDDHGQVMEVLAAFVREHSAWQPAARHESETVTSRLEPSYEEHAIARRQRMPALSVEVRAVLSVIQRRRRQHDYATPRGFDLSHTDLRQADAEGIHLPSGSRLIGAHLDRANLADAHLSGVDFRAADLTRADLSGAELVEVNLIGADLQDAGLARTNLTRARLARANLARASLSAANLRSASLVAARMEDAEMTGALFEHASLRGANLERAVLNASRFDRADLTEARLAEASLADAFLNNVSLARAHLERAVLKGARLDGADLTDAHLGGADLRGASLDGANLSGAWIDGARLPMETREALQLGARVKDRP